MGISLMQEQVLAKIDWLTDEIGMKEKEEDTLERYILTKHYSIVTTPSETQEQHEKRPKNSTQE